MEVFFIVISILVIQRLTELKLAAKNEKIMKNKGAIEYGEKHYKILVIMHILFFISFMSEVILLDKKISPFWPILLTIIMLTQILRYWSILSLGEYWNTKILILPNGNVKRKGPYQFIRHPNYVAVALEFIFIPLLFQAYWTAIIFMMFNSIMMIIRIKEEEKALLLETDYADVFKSTSRILLKDKKV